MKISKHKKLKRILGLCQCEGCRQRNSIEISAKDNSTGKRLGSTLHLCSQCTADFVQTIGEATP